MKLASSCLVRSGQPRREILREKRKCGEERSLPASSPPPQTPGILPLIAVTSPFRECVSPCLLLSTSNRSYPDSLRPSQSPPRRLVPPAMTNIDIQPYPPLRSHASEQQSNANQQQQGEQQQGHGQQQHSPNIPHHPGSWHAYGNSPTASNPSYHFTTPSSPSAPSPTTANRNGSGTPSQSHGQAQADGSGSQNGSSSSPGNNNDSAPQSHSNYGPDPNVPKPKPLACFRCKNKKGKCDDRMPICGPCVKANAECVRPSERKRKRTRKEMTEAELAEKERKARDSEKKARLAQASTDGGQSRADLVSPPPIVRVQSCLPVWL